VKPERHVTSWLISLAEAAELGPLLRRASQVAKELVEAEQVYNCLWSHAGGAPVHIHFVIQPVTADLLTHFGTHGPALQVAMFAGGDAPNPHDVERVTDAARVRFSIVGNAPPPFSSPAAVSSGNLPSGLHRWRNLLLESVDDGNLACPRVPGDEAAPNIYAVGPSRVISN
jgi:hypothetical protein